MTSALRTRWPDVTVETVGVRQRLDGAAVKAILEIGSDSPSAPSTVCVKGGFEQEHADYLAQMGMYEREGRFYTDVASRIPDLAVPDVIFVASDPETRHCVLVMEDLTALGAEFLSAERGSLDATQVAALLADLARVHAHRWHDPALAAEPWLDSLLNPDSGVRQMFRTLAESVDQWLRLPRGDVIPQHLHDPERIVCAFWAMFEQMDPARLTFLHGDSHFGNTYRLPDGTPGLCDWQTVCAGPWAQDVAYLMGSSMTIEDRRKHERELIAGYLDALGAAGARPPTFDDAWLDYRKASMYGFYAWLTNRPEWQPEHVNVPTTARFAAAVEDLEVFAALGVS